jgi:SNF2 family DNA or RNA helicase
MDLGESVEAPTQTDVPVLADKAVQTDADMGTKDNPFLLDDDDLFNPHGAVSDEDEEDITEADPPAVDDDKFFYGTAFEKVEEFDHHLDESNPWHPDLSKPLFPSQIIGFRWMASRHVKGGGLVGDKVGCGKVIPWNLSIKLTTDLSIHQFHSMAPNNRRTKCVAEFP